MNRCSSEPVSELLRSVMWNNRGTQVLLRPGRTDQDAARSLVLKGELGRVENYVYD